VVYLLTKIRSFLDFLLGFCGSWSLERSNSAALPSLTVESATHNTGLVQKASKCRSTNRLRTQLDSEFSQDAFWRIVADTKGHSSSTCPHANALHAKC
jgi:hypothetical protein